MEEQIVQPATQPLVGQASTTVAILQAQPRLGNIQGSLQVADTWISIASCQGVNLLLFPEAFLGGHASQMHCAGLSEQQRQALKVQYQNSAAIRIPGPEIEVISARAQLFLMHIAIGAVEQDPEDVTKVYSTLVLCTPRGGIVRHRKTALIGETEQFFWTAATAGASRGAHLSIYSPIWSWSPVTGTFGNEQFSGSESPESQEQVFLAPAGEAYTEWPAFARERHCFVLVNQRYSSGREQYPASWLTTLSARSHREERSNRGGSAILGPDGCYLVAPVWGREELLVSRLRSPSLERMDS